MHAVRNKIIYSYSTAHLSIIYSELSCMHHYQSSSERFFLYIFYKSEVYHQSVTGTEQKLQGDQLLKIICLSKITHAPVFPICLMESIIYSLSSGLGWGLVG